MQVRFVGLQLCALLTAGLLAVPAPAQQGDGLRFGAGRVRPDRDETVVPPSYKEARSGSSTSSATSSGGSTSNATGGSVVSTQPSHLGRPTDWSFRHVLHHNAVGDGFDAEADLALKDPRVLYNWYEQVRARNFASSRLARHGRKFHTTTSHVDWHFPLGAGTVAPNMYPAKYSFDVNATPSCALDYAVFGLNTAGSSSQPNLVAFSNLYAGTVTASTFSIAASTGASESGTTVTLTTTVAHGLAVGNTIYVQDVADGRYNGQFTIASVPTTTTLTYTSTASSLPTSGGGTVGLVNSSSSACTSPQGGPAVKFAYNVSTLGGSILTSPVISIDGTKIAFIESAASSAAFKVLALPAHPGTEGSFAYGTNVYTAATPGSGGSAASIQSVTYSATATNTRSSPYLDYGNDVAYFGDDSGKLYKTTCVFLCALSGKTFGIATGWPITVDTGFLLAPPVIDVNTMKLFVGSSSGKLFVINLASCSAGCTGPFTSATIGDGTANGGIIDAPILDTTFQTVFVTTGSSGSVVQLNESLTALTTDAFGASPYPLAEGTLDTEYYNNNVGDAVSATTGAAKGNGYFCGAQNGSTKAQIYSVSFTGKFLAAGKITSAVEAGSTVTITSSSANGFTAGETVVVSGITPAGFNGTFTIATASGTTFTYTDGTTGLGTASSVGSATAVEELSTVNPPLMSAATGNLIGAAAGNRSACSPVVAFSNGSNEWLFFSQPSSLNTCTGGTSSGCFFQWPITGSTGALGTMISAVQAGGTSAPIIDNVSASAQASSVYFTNQSSAGTAGTGPACNTGASTASFCAIKLTQSALQ